MFYFRYSVYDFNSSNITRIICTNAIGFEIPSCVEEMYDDEEEEEDKLKLKHKIGF